MNTTTPTPFTTLLSTDNQLTTTIDIQQTIWGERDTFTGSITNQVQIITIRPEPPYDFVPVIVTYTPPTVNYPQFPVLPVVPVLPVFPVTPTLPVPDTPFVPGPLDTPIVHIPSICYPAHLPEPQTPSTVIPEPAYTLLFGMLLICAVGKKLKHRFV